MVLTLSSQLPVFTLLSETFKEAQNLIHSAGSRHILSKFELTVRSLSIFYEYSNFEPMLASSTISTFLTRP